MSRGVRRQPVEGQKGRSCPAGGIETCEGGSGRLCAQPWARRRGGWTGAVKSWAMAEQEPRTGASVVKFCQPPRQAWADTPAAGVDTAHVSEVPLTPACYTWRAWTRGFGTPSPVHTPCRRQALEIEPHPKCERICRVRVLTQDMQPAAGVYAWRGSLARARPSP